MSTAADLQHFSCGLAYVSESMIILGKQHGRRHWHCCSSHWEWHPDQAGGWHRAVYGFLKPKAYPEWHTSSKTAPTNPFQNVHQTGTKHQIYKHMGPSSCKPPQIPANFQHQLFKGLSLPDWNKLNFWLKISLLHISEFLFVLSLFSYNTLGFIV